MLQSTSVYFEITSFFSLVSVKYSPRVLCDEFKLLLAKAKNTAKPIRDILNTNTSRGATATLGSFSAAARYAPTVRYNKVFVYVNIQDKQEFIKDFGLKRVETGGNIVICSLYDSIPTMFSRYLSYSNNIGFAFTYRTRLSSRDFLCVDHPYKPGSVRLAAQQSSIFT